MSCFHVLAEFEGNANKLECLFQDLSEEKLKKEFVSPYQEGISIFHNGVVIKTNAISKVKIVKTDQNSELELKNLQERSRREIDEINRDSYVQFISLGRGYETSDLQELGSDVTSTYINGAPGYLLKQSVTFLAHPSSQPNMLAKVINHQWFVAIVGGLVVSGIVFLVFGA